MLWTAGCAQLPPREAVPAAAATAPAGFPARDYERLAAQGRAVYRVDPVRSLVVITVRRAGSLARLGHDHVVAARAVQGYVAPDEGRADLYLPLAELTVDEPALRAQAGFDTQPTAADVEGTRANMHDKVLETQRFPHAFIRVSSVERSTSGARLQLALVLHGVTHNFDVPAQVQATGSELRVEGSLAFKQSDFGIVPFSILGGAVQVQDALDLRFAVRAVRGMDDR
ncbi:MAG TPA: YceI family protein [Variovorax sp.]|nr:YceI family protein [Variovorax sp.]